MRRTVSFQTVTVSGISHIPIFLFIISFPSPMPGLLNRWGAKFFEKKAEIEYLGIGGPLGA